MRKLDKICKTAVSKYWITGSAVLWSKRVRKQSVPYNCPGLLPGATFPDSSIKEGTQAWHWGLAKLGRQRSGFREAEPIGIYGARVCQRGKNDEEEF